MVMNALHYRAVQEEMKQNLTLRSNQPHGHILSPVEAHDMCSSTPASLVWATFLCLFGCFLSPSHICLFCLRLSLFNNSSMPVWTRRCSPSHRADSILRVPSTTFNISHPSVLLRDLINSTEVFLSPPPGILHILFFTSYLYLLVVTVWAIVSVFSFILAVYSGGVSACGSNLSNYVCVSFSIL